MTPLNSVKNIASHTPRIHNHQSRLPNYQQLQAQGFAIGSGAVESVVKQIGRRVKISGAQWRAENVDQVVKHRVAYLNGWFTQSISQKAS